MGSLVVGTRKGVFVLRRRGEAWRIEYAALLGDPVTMVLGTPDGALHRRSGHGPLRREDETLARRRRDLGRPPGSEIPA